MRYFIAWEKITLKQHALIVMQDPYGIADNRNENMQKNLNGIPIGRSAEYVSISVSKGNDMISRIPSIHHIL